MELDVVTPWGVDETRVRLSIKQTAKGSIQLDLTAEASTVEKAKELLSQGIDAITVEIGKRGLKLASE